MFFVLGKAMKHEVPVEEDPSRDTRVQFYVHGDNGSKGRIDEPPGFRDRFSITQFARIVLPAHR
jgi:hypothetical protein